MTEAIHKSILLYDSIFMKFKNGRNEFMITAVRIKVMGGGVGGRGTAWGGARWKLRKGRRGPEGTLEILFIWVKVT